MSGRREARWFRRGGCDPDAGQILLLTIGYAMIALALVLVIGSASAVHLERKSLLALAEGAALDAADAVDLDLFYGADSFLDAVGEGSFAGLVPLSDAAVREAAVEYLRDAPAAAGITGLAIGEPTGSPDGRSARVTLVALARPPLVPWVLVGWSEGIALQVTATARAG